MFGKFWADAKGTRANARRNLNEARNERERIRVNKLRWVHHGATVFDETLLLREPSL
jgi:hypothetical protein